MYSHFVKLLTHNEFYYLVQIFNAAKIKIMKVERKGCGL